MRASLFGFAGFAFVLLGCGGSSSPDAPPADSGAAGGDTGHDSGMVSDSRVGDVGEDTKSPIDISGSLTVTARVVTIDDKGVKVPQAAFPARIENPGGGFIDAATGADGVVSFKVDAAKGPFDVTAAKVGFGIISVMGISGPVGDLITYEFKTPMGAMANVAGKIDGKKDPANKVQIDAWAFSTVVTAASAVSYTSKYSNIADLPLVVAAVEVDSTGAVINGSLTSPQVRTGSGMTADVKLPAPANTPNKRTINVKFPTAGPVAGKLTKVADPTTDKHLGNALVVKSNKFNEMFVGVGTATVPAAGSASILVESFGGDMAPDKVTAAWAGTTIYARINLLDIADGATTTFGDVSKLDIGGSDLATLTFAADGVGYEYADIELVDATAGGVVWRAYSNGPKLASRGLPHLPLQTKLVDVGGAGFLPTGTVVLVHQKGASATPWGDNASFDWVVSNTTDAMLDGAGR